MSESVTPPEELYRSELLRREADGNDQLIEEIVAREQALDAFLAHGDHDTDEAQKALRDYYIRASRVNGIKRRFNIRQPEPLPIETED